MKKLLKVISSLILIAGVDSLALDNEIVIYGKVLDEVSVKILHVDNNSNKEGLYLLSNSDAGATVLVKNIIKNSKKQIYRNGILSKLPIVYDLYDGPFVLGTSPFDIKEDITLVIEVKAH